MRLDRITRNLQSTISAGKIVETRLPLVPEITLYLLADDYPRGPLPHEEMLAIMNRPAYWSFCWASGQVLARYILDHAERFAGRSVVDFGSGSGVVAVACARAGAQRVAACDIDPQALDASAANARLNDVAIELLDDMASLDFKPDIAIAADVLYDRDNLCWLGKLREIAGEVLVGDSRIKAPGILTINGYEVVDQVTATTVPDLDELREYNEVRIYRATHTPPRGHG